jgi:hypothetical protein
MGVENKTIKYKGVELDIEFYFSPSEASVMYYSDGSGYPGCAEEVEIYSVGHNGADISELIDDQLDNIEEELLKQIHNHENN